MRHVIVEVLVLTFLVVLELSYAFAPIVSYQWVVSYSQRSILGGNKQIIVINDMFPGPILNATANDIIIVNIFNNLNEPFLMTWNGLQLRKNSWQDGVRGTNCPILPGTNWTYSFQVKDQIGSYFYFPSLLLQKAAGGYGSIRINTPELVPVPFPTPDSEYDILVGDWFYADHTDLRASLDTGHSLPTPDGILINGRGPEETFFAFEPGKMYRLRISNVGLKTCVNFRIQDHDMLLVETEGTYVQKRVYSSLDIHVGQSYSVLVTAKTDPVGINRAYYILATARFTDYYLGGIALIRYPNSPLDPVGSVPLAPASWDYASSVEQALSIRMDLNVGAARTNPQGSYHYGRIKVARTILLHNDVMLSSGRLRYTINGVSFVYPETPLKLVDHFQLNDTIIPNMFPNYPTNKTPSLGTSVVDIRYRDFVHIVFQNPLFELQSYHIDGYNFFVVGYGFGAWSESKRAGYNLVDAVSRSTVQVYPYSWAAILIAMDNQGMWNVRSQKAEQWYLGQELYMRVKGEGQEDPSNIPVRDENPIPENVIRCGRVL
ncbi:PREDICTED: monocopper oxidase-like protein SKS1 [Camelina sativa]|uniref:Monocopper oxidase-like protein SKS1 n=1 Tax=Camelina sativa TaxID=90675 RepID=A0ABM1QG97_CAMSA|nr:PREDICTED: monocopper oxidase-like protein SKS1 [Camelina sativa]